MTIEKRLDQLEMKLSFQEDNIETLNTEIFEQQRKLHTLKGQVSYLVQKLKEAEPDSSGTDEVEMRPPHY
ncbi:SlyX family protein [Psychromonas sp. CD1]|uniref:SlyX family protein n=1 Tax=Psychromonas sp. CD1 TaxID=1979839 RepID=UPI000B9ABE52|nr:SlyX family protein [Psychromonas sp. CD1]